MCTQVERGDPGAEAKLFSIPDFIGFACREVGEYNSSMWRFQLADVSRCSLELGDGL